jgi:hypothetical protein
MPRPTMAEILDCGSRFHPGCRKCEVNKRYVWKVKVGSRALIIRRRNPNNSFIFPIGKSSWIPTLRRGPFYLTGLVSWKWGEIELSLTRWL